MGAPTVSVDMMAKQVLNILQDYRQYTQKALETAVKKGTSAGLKKVKETSQRFGSKYASGWQSKAGEKTAQKQSRFIMNKMYTLPHLLEHGHVLKGWVAAYSHLSRVPAYPHVAPAEEVAIQEFENELKKAIERGM